MVLFATFKQLEAQCWNYAADMLEMRALSSTLQSVTELIFIRRGAVQSYTVETLGLRTKLLQRWYALREYMDVRYVEENEF